MTDRPKTVGIAKPEDKDRLYEFLLGLYKDNFVGFRMSVPKVKDVVTKCCDHQGGIAGIIENGAGEIVASVGIIFQASWYSDEYYLGELWLFVDPGWRRTRAADDLAKFSLWYREQMKSSDTGEPPVLVTSVTSRKRLKAKMRWWQKWGTQIGAIFVVD